MEVLRGNGDIKWLDFRLQRSFSHLPSPEIASELRWPANTVLDTSSIFFFIGMFKYLSSCPD